jgi:hypothetical protein
LSKAELDELVNQGYAAYAETWKSVGGALEALNVFMHNQSARIIARNNLFNPHVREWLRSPGRHQA